MRSVSNQYTNPELYALAAGAEQLSEYPLGKAIVRCCQKELAAPLPKTEQFRMIPGRGVCAAVNGVSLLAGNPELLQEQGVAFTVPADAEMQLQQGATVIYLAADGQFAGYIAMGGTGSDIAVDAADIALVDDEVKELPHLIALSQRMMRTIHLNLTFSMTLNFIAITLAITGILNPVVGALVHNVGSVLVIVNSALLLNWRKKV